VSFPLNKTENGIQVIYLLFILHNTIKFCCRRTHLKNAYARYSRKKVMDHWVLKIFWTCCLCSANRLLGKSKCTTPLKFTVSWQLIIFALSNLVIVIDRHYRKATDYIQCTPFFSTIFFFFFYGDSAVISYTVAKCIIFKLLTKYKEWCMCFKYKYWSIYTQYSVV